MRDGSVLWVEGVAGSGHGHALRTLGEGGKKLALIQSRTVKNTGTHSRCNQERSTCPSRPWPRRRR